MGLKQMSPSIFLLSLKNLSPSIFQLSLKQMKTHLKNLETQLKQMGHSCFLTTERFRCYIKNALFPLKTNVGITFALVLITFLKNIQTFFVLPTFVYFCKNFKTCDNSVGQLQGKIKVSGEMQVEKFLTRLFFLSFGQQPRIGQEPVRSA